MNHTSISVLLPSRARPELLSECGEALFTLAEGNVEMVVRFDDDDPELQRNLDVIARLRSEMRAVNYLIKQHGRGYPDNHLMIEDCARIAVGDVLMQYNDDMIMQTHGWDTKYKEILNRQPISVVSAYLTADNSATTEGFRFSCPTISRKLYRLCEGFCLGNNPSVDRCWAAFAINYPCEVRAEVYIHHMHVGTGDFKAIQARTNFYAELVDNKQERFQEHDAIGKKYVERVKRLLGEKG